MKRLFVIAAAGALLVGCQQLQEAGGALATYRAVTDPAVPLQDKACTVLAWGVPIGMDRAAKADLSVKQRYYVQAAADIGRSYCEGKDLRWQDRAVQAADTLSKVLWDVVK